jgi:hypothetical protein
MEGSHGCLQLIEESSPSSSSQISLFSDSSFLSPGLSPSTSYVDDSSF